MSPTLILRTDRVGDKVCAKSVGFVDGDSGDARGDSREDFVRNGVQLAGDVPGPDRVCAIGAEDGHHVSDDCFGNFGQVDHGAVHADGTPDRRSSPSDQHVAVG